MSSCLVAYAFLNDVFLLTAKAAKDGLDSDRQVLIFVIFPVSILDLYMLTLIFLFFFLI